MKEFVFVTARLSVASKSRRPGQRRIEQWERGLAEIRLQRTMKTDIKARLAAAIDDEILNGSGSGVPVGLLSIDRAMENHLGIPVGMIVRQPNGPDTYPIITTPIQRPHTNLADEWHKFNRALEESIWQPTTGGGVAAMEKVEMTGKKKAPYVIVRTYSAGVFAGNLISQRGKNIVMANARRLWYWAGAASLSQLAVTGTSKPLACKFPIEMPRVQLTEAIEIIDVTLVGESSIKAVPVWQS